MSYSAHSRPVIEASPHPAHSQPVIEASSYSAHYQPVTEESTRRTALLNSLRQLDFPNIQTLLAHPAYSTHDHPDLRQALYQCIILRDPLAVYEIYLTNFSLVHAACEFLGIPGRDDYITVVEIPKEHFARLATWAGIVYSSHHGEDRDHDDPLMWIT
ncbi:hypothetical protein Q9L58_005899 [Maublancomyces gigas]|uniref:Uncharacterized protein n=1 Tax=Discina gigas TaxID=1032678 RepID=A0ABR3GGU3_9PEZI